MATHKLKEPVEVDGKTYEQVNVRELRWKHARAFTRAMREHAGDDMAMVEAIAPFIVEATGLPEPVLDEFALADIQTIVELMQDGERPLAQPATSALSSK